MKNKFWGSRIIFLLFVLMLICPSTIFAAGSVQVQGFITNSDGSVPAAEDLKITAFVEGNESDVQSLTNAEITAAANPTFTIFFFLTGNFAPIPEAGANIVININNTKNNELKVINHTLTTVDGQFVTGTSDTNPLALDTPTLLSIALTPDDPSVTVPGTQQLTAMGTFEGVTNPVDISSSVTWNTTNEDVGTINAAGLFTPNLVGSTDITVSSGTETSNTITMTVSAGPANTVAIDSGNNQSGAVGSDLTLAVKVTDVNGNAVSGATVAFAVTTDPVSGAKLSSASITTGTDGKATVTLTLGTVAKDYTTTATVGAIAPVTFTSTATPGALAGYTVAYTPAFDATAGTANTISVTAKDANGNTITNHTGTVSFTATDSAAVLPADYTFLAGDNGVKTFSVTLKTAGAQTVTATTGSVSGTVDGTVVPAAASKIDLKTSATTVASEGIGTATLTATIQDAFGNTVTAENGDVTFTVTGDTSNAGWTTKAATLNNGIATATFTTTGTVGGDGSADVTVTAGKDALTTASVALTIVNFSVTPAASNARIGDTIDLTVEGAQGTVTWTVGGDAGVGSLGSYDGVNKEKAVFTVVKAGDATITVTEGGKTSTATIAAHDDVAITDKPEGTVTVKPGADSAEFSVTGGDGNYTWTVTGPSSVTGGTAAAYTFTAPSTGNFAGPYTITVTDNVNTNSESFKIYVPLKIEPAKTGFVLLSNSGAKPFTITGAANATPYTRTIDSLDDTMADDVFSGTFSAQYSAAIAFDPADYTTVTADTGTKQYTLDFEAKDHESLPQITIDVVPVKDFTGIITDSDESPLDGAVVTITSPAGYEGLTRTSAVGTGAFTFANLPVVEKAKYLFKVEKADYLITTFSSTDLDDDGFSKIKMKSSEAVISGAITNPGGEVSSVTLFDKDGKFAGPVDSDTSGNFRFEFETAPAVPVSYTIKASRPGFSGYTAITAESFDYTNISFALTALALPVDLTVTGTAPTSDGVIDASAGGECDMTADAGLDADVQAAFGTNTIKLVIDPQADGEVVVVALPETAVYTDTAATPDSALKWEIDGLGSDGCAVIPVPFNLSDADKIRNGSLTVLYAHESAPTTWKPATIVGEIDYVGDGTNGIIYAEICGWSSNVVGIGSSPSSTSSTASDSSSSCFISSLAGTGSSHMPVWISVIAVLAAGILIAVTRKQKTN